MTSNGMRFMGIDYGTKRVGIALSDVEGKVGFPHGVFANDSELLGKVAALAHEKGVEAFVVGESKNNSGKDNEVMARARQFTDVLGRMTHIPVFFESEQFTSQQVRKEMDHKGEVDAEAAAIILNSHIERAQSGTRKIVDN